MGMFSYNIKMICRNCGTTSIIKIPNKVLIKDFVKEGGRCSYCKCSDFEGYYKQQRLNLIE